MLSLVVKHFVNSYVYLIGMYISFQVKEMDISVSEGQNLSL
jgi:hypothetical protein